MAKVVVIGASSADVALMELLEAADCELVAPSDHTVEEQEDADESEAQTDESQDDADAVEVLGKAHDDEGEGELVIVVLTPECSSDPALDAIVTNSIAKGKRVIGVWPHGSDAGSIPSCIEQFGDAAITWNPESLRRVIVEEKPQWQTPTGTARPDSNIKRNCT